MCLLVTEIMYHPADPDENYEYIEVVNPLRTPLELNPSVSGEPTDWRLRGEADLDFKTGTTIAPYGVALLVPFDPDVDTVAKTAFLAKYPTAVGGN